MKRWGPLGGFGLPLALAVLLVALATHMTRLEPMFQAAFPAQERAMYRQEPFISLLWSHVVLVFASSASAAVVALAAGLWVTRTAGRSYRSLVESLVAMGQTFPPVAVLALAVPLIGFGEKPAFVALAVYGVLPILQGVIAGLESTPTPVKEAAKGMGFNAWQIFMQVELPLAAPLLLAGLRTSVTINIGTAALAATVGAQNLGSPIIIGLSGFNTAYVLQGALLTGLLAITVDIAFECLSQQSQRWKFRVGD